MHSIQGVSGLAEFVKVAQVSQLGHGKSMVVEAKGIAIALHNVGGKVFATGNTCAHRGGPLGEGVLEGNAIMCPWHGWQYDVTNGKCATMPSAHVQTYKVKIEGEHILVEL